MPLISQRELSSVMVGIEQVHSSVHVDMSTGDMSTVELVQGSVAIAIGCWRSHGAVNLE